MAHFKKPKWPERNASGAHWPLVRPAATHRREAAIKESLFRAQDWAGVARLVEQERDSTVGVTDQLTSALAELRRSLDGPVVLVSQIIEQLIDVWALASCVSADVARPAEALLWAMEGCDLVTAGQVGAVCDHVEAALKLSVRGLPRPGAGGAGPAGVGPEGPGMCDDLPLGHGATAS